MLIAVVRLVGGAAPRAAAVLTVLLAAALAATSACSFREAENSLSGIDDGTSGSPAAPGGDPRRRDIDEMMRAKYGHHACEQDGDCPFGTHCDGQACTYECVSDDGCDRPAACTDRGTCELSFRLLSDTTAPSCASKTPQEIVDQLLAMDGVKCSIDDDCPCGAFCDNLNGGFCRFDCMTSNLSGDYPCTGDGLTCNHVGQCVASTHPAPSVQLALQMSPDLVTADTYASTVTAPVTISVDALSTEFIQTTHPAEVKYHFVGIDDPDFPDVVLDPSTIPHVKCSESGTFATSCTVQGWQFDTASHSTHSAPKTIYVQLPKATTPQVWTLEAVSDWAADPKTIGVEARPVPPPPAVPGRYAGTLTFTNAGNPSMSADVEALVTDTHVALIDPSRAFLPDGHAVVSRDPSTVTMVRWLSATIGGTTSGYDVQVKLGALAQDSHTGRLTFGPSTLKMGAGAPANLSLVLDRTANLDAVCTDNSSCASGAYCDAVIRRCLPGSGPAAGGGIVAATSTAANPSITVPSSSVASWASSVASLATNNSLAGTGIAGIERAYCADNAAVAAAHFNVGQVVDGRFVSTQVQPLAPASLDRQCREDGSDTPYRQGTFPYVDVQRDFIPGADRTQDQVFTDACAAELDASPSSSASTALAARQCVSPGRFFLALHANLDGSGAGVPGPDTQQRFISQIIRQWLGLHTYLASTAVQAQDFLDIFAIGTTSRHGRLGQSVDRMEAGLRVLLDKSVWPQFTSGKALASVVNSPDYRWAQRPVVRWTFNTAQSTVSNAEGTGPAFLTANVDLTAKDLNATIASGTHTCESASAVTLDANRYALVAHVRYSPANGVTVNLIDKVAANSKHLWLDAVTFDGGQHLNLQLHDSDGGGASFVVPWDAAKGGLLAIVGDTRTYRAYVASSGNVVSTAATGITGTGPTWGDPGIVKLQCSPPTNNGTCTSWDRNTLGDGLDVVTSSTAETAWSKTKSCDYDPTFKKWLCDGSAGSATECSNTGWDRRSALISGLLPNPPQWALDQFTVTSSYQAVRDFLQLQYDNTTGTCTLQIQNLPGPVTGVKPVCPANQIRWDEVSLWTRPLTFDEFRAMAAQYGENPGNESLPAKEELGGGEQPTGLAVYLTEAADAQLDLLATYLAAADDAVYADCHAGRASTELPIARDRAGRTLRLAAVLEAEATALAGLADQSASWQARYQAAVQRLATRQNAVAQQLRLLGECKNSLGISDDEVPVYRGAGPSTSPANKFFAGSAFLVGLAENEVGINAGTFTAQGLLQQARDAYLRVRQSQIDAERGDTEKSDRINALTVSYEDQLKRYCGAAPADLNGGHPLLDGFGSRTLSPRNCFIKLEVSRCQGFAFSRDGFDYKQVPDDCFRGALGERVIALKTAQVDADNASHAAERATKLWDTQTKQCLRVAQDALAASTALRSHQATMKSLENKLSWLGEARALINGITADVAAAASGGKVGSGNSDLVSVALTRYQNHLNAEIVDENNRYQREVLDRAGLADIAACQNTADQMKINADGSADAITKAAQESAAVLHSLADDMNTVAAIAGQAQAQIALENTINRTPPQFHYWLDQTIADYNKELAYARRLTYLAVRAFEYETQRDSTLRGAVLAARVPADLHSILQSINAQVGTAQFTQNALGLTPVDATLTLSLRDEILQIQDQRDPRDPSKLVRTKQEVFNNLLMSDASKIYAPSATGPRFVGRGIRFSIKPAQWNQGLCADRSWRLTPLPDVLPNVPTVFLYQTNTFGSQTCRATPGNLTLTRLRQNVNLLVGDAPVDYAVADPFYSSPISLDPTLNVTGLRQLSPDSSKLDASFAGRGLYGDYILVFPFCDPNQSCTGGYTDAVLRTLFEVNIRFDLAAASNVPPIGNP